MSDDPLSDEPLSNEPLSDEPLSDEPLSDEEEIALGQLEPTVVIDGAFVPHGVNLPENWPDERAFIPPPPAAHPPKSKPYSGPVMTHTKIYSGNDSAVTEALASYVYFRDDARKGGWQSYLKRSDDFIQFCCRMHIFEMLSARGGGGETRVVYRWLESR